jgi:hypothetical protein
MEVGGKRRLRTSIARPRCDSGLSCESGCEVGAEAAESGGGISSMSEYASDWPL